MEVAHYIFFISMVLLTTITVNQGVRGLRLAAFGKSGQMSECCCLGSR